jgi:hypothetical protein
MRFFDDSYWRELVAPTFTNRSTSVDLNNMSFDQLVPSNSKYLTKDDAGEDGIILTIKGFRMETLKSDEGDEEKMVMHFVENVKPMILNRTNAQLVGVCTGAKTAGEARGKKIVVFNDPTVGFGGKITGGLRIKKVAGQPKPAPAQAAGESFDDSEIPF